MSVFVTNLPKQKNYRKGKNLVRKTANTVKEGGKEEEI